jgi:hypothetical protein
VCWWPASDLHTRVIVIKLTPHCRAPISNRLQIASSSAVYAGRRAAGRWAGRDKPTIIFARRPRCLAKPLPCAVDVAHALLLGSGLRRMLMKLGSGDFHRDQPIARRFNSALSWSATLLVLLQGFGQLHLW